MVSLDRATANAIYSLLVAELAADEYWRDNFIATVTETDGTGKEYRLSSRLGFGGKFRNNHNGIYVDCYPEDETEERRIMIAKTNDQLRGMGFPVPEGM
jgi:hypothetical protein